MTCGEWNEVTIQKYDISATRREAAPTEGRALLATLCACEPRLSFQNGTPCVAVKKGVYAGKREREQRFFIEFETIQSFFVYPAASQRPRLKKVTLGKTRGSIPNEPHAPAISK
ncbi:hypothetical protein CCACVL1_21698 [Corchorus capsularis]|uniref:Uncharacterized protein n=1 Tax=Corchorus capsularis TaxID=210143 RepID=A0A1R3H2C3_COCAP|nr:hypothetical protein CCACVL1_21698 [Corchorus capsularis]